jgi:hypothetical protein
MPILLIEWGNEPNAFLVTLLPDIEALKIIYFSSFMEYRTREGNGVSFRVYNEV